MKTMIAGMAATLLAGAAFAQTMTPADQSTTTPTPADTMASKPGTEMANLVERNGKWWNGDREATPQEIEAYKKTKKYTPPK